MAEKEKANAVELTESERLDLQLKQLELLERQANLEDVQERLAERRMKRETQEQRKRTNGTVLKQNEQRDKQVQTRCNHRKGGNGADGIIGGQGDDPQYAVIKHRMANNDVWVRCLRCGKTWKPPVEADFLFNEKGEIHPNGKLNEAEFLKAVREYQEAVAFPTRNATSGGVVFQYSDGGKFYRETMRSTNLR